jgi:aspartate kinase
MKCTVFKFGGASVRDPKRIKNVAGIIQQQKRKKLVIVLSAMGKNTNQLEGYVTDYLKSKKSLGSNLEAFAAQHYVVAQALDVNPKDLKKKYTKLAKACQALLASQKKLDEAYIYDQIVSLGELYSTVLVHNYLSSVGLSVAWLDIRGVLKTDRSYREGKVDFKKTVKLVSKKIKALTKEADVIITQGFLGGTADGATTTLGREGSDYTAAILAYALGVEELTVWKDVPGILTADPRRFDNVELLERLTYREAIEMTYYGAKVIHPKTIQPIQNKGIRLKVKSFIHPENKGTVISTQGQLKYPPIVVIQDDVILLQISSKDFSFISEDHLSFIFEKMRKHKIKLGVMRNSAISFTLVILPVKESLLKTFIKDISVLLTVDITRGLQMMTIRHFQESLLHKLIQDKVILFEETLDDTVTMVLKASLEFKEG